MIMNEWSGVLVVVVVANRQYPVLTVNTFSWETQTETLCMWTDQNSETVHGSSEQIYDLYRSSIISIYTFIPTQPKRTLISVIQK